MVEEIFCAERDKEMRMANVKEDEADELSIVGFHVDFLGTSLVRCGSASYRRS